MLGFIKGFIEKNTWIGLEDFYDSLSQALMHEYNIPPAKAKRRNRKLTANNHAASPTLPNLQTASSLPNAKQTEKGETHFSAKQPTKVYGIKKVHNMKEQANVVGKTNGLQNKLSWIVIILLIILFAFNVKLYVQMRRLDDYDTHHHEIIK